MTIALSALWFPIQYLEVCDTVIRAHNGDLADFHARCGVLTEDIVNPLAMINGEQILIAYTTVQQYCRPDYPASLQILEHFPLTAHGMLGMLALASRTVGDALNAALEFFPLMMPAFTVKRINHKKDIHLIFNRVCDFGDQNNFFTELVMSALHKIMPFTLTPLDQIQVNLQHKLVHDIQHYQRILGIMVKDNAPLNSIILPKKLLDTLLITQSPTLHQILQTSLRQRMQINTQTKPVSQQVKRLIKLFLDENRIINSDLLAEALHLSRRTLSRRLVEEETSLTQLHREVAIDYAQWLLINGQLSIEDIAHKSGFSNATNFSRVFKQITGKTPSQFRTSQ